MKGKILRKIFGPVSIDNIWRTRNNMEIDKNNRSCSLLYGGWGTGLLDGGTRSRVYWVGRGLYMGVYCANLSIVQFRAMMLGIHVYVYIGYMVMDIQ